MFCTRHLLALSGPGKLAQHGLSPKPSLCCYGWKSFTMEWGWGLAFLPSFPYASCLLPGRFSNAFSYYGLVLLTTELFQAGDVCSSEYHSLQAVNALHPTQHTTRPTHKVINTLPAPVLPSQGLAWHKIQISGTDVCKI